MQKKWLLIFSIISLLSVLTIIRTNVYIQNSSELAKCSLMYINEYAKKVYVDSPTELIASLEGVDSYVIWSKFDDIVGLLYTPNDFSPPPIIEGRFLDSSDFFCNKNIAVIGINLQSMIYEVDSKKYINLFDRQYTVIGLVGYSNFKSPLDNCVYYNLDSRYDTIFYIDGINKRNAATNFANISDIVDLKLIDDPPQSLDRLLNHSKSKKSTILIIFHIVIIVAAWLSIKFYSNAVYNILRLNYILGITNFKNIILNNSLFIIIYICSCIGCTLFYYVANCLQINKYYYLAINYYNIFWSLIVFLILNIILVFLHLNRLIRKLI